MVTLPGSSVQTFICQNQDDYRKLLALNNTMFTDDRGMRRKVAIHSTVVEVTEQSVNPQRPCNPQQLQHLGFDGFAIDFVEAEPHVVAYLCQSARLHSCVRFIVLVTMLTTTGGHSASGEHYQPQRGCEHRH